MGPGYRRWLTAGTAAVATVAAGTAAVVVRSQPGAADAWWHPGPPFVRGAQTVPVYSYPAAIRESVLVPTGQDSDGDGQPDQVAVDIVRPREAADAGVRVPVIVDASPYYRSIGRGPEHEVKKYDAAGTIASFPGFYDNYFVPRGYAVALVDLPGTNRSTGCLDVGGPVETAAVVAVIDWLGGRGRATYRDGTPAASGLSTGRVGMIGKSWDGAVANGVAVTGVPGLATVVSLSGVSSWYDYVVPGGVLPADEDPTYLEDVGDRPKGRCDAARAGRRAAAGTGGDDNAFWTPRDFRAGAGRVRASVFVVQGLGDLNVLPSQGAAWWSALGAAHVPRKLWLSQEGHVDPFDFRRTAWVDTLHRWFDRWLQDLPDGVMATPAVSVERAPGQWVDDSSWPAAGSHPQRLALGTGDGTTGTLGGTGAATRTFTDDPALTQARAVTDPAAARPGRLVFLSGVLTADTRISGTGSVTLRVRVNRPTTELSVRLVDYGTADRVDPGTPGEGVHRLGSRSCWGDSSPADSACYPDFAADVARRDLAIVSRGWLDAAHHTSLTRTTPLATGQWYPVTVSLQPADAVVPAGHVLGLVVTGTDPGGNAPAATGATIAVDLAGSQADLPVVDPTGVPTGVAVPPAVAGHAGQHSGVIRRWRF